jgi:hypothetical protein
MTIPSVPRPRSIARRTLLQSGLTLPVLPGWHHELDRDAITHAPTQHVISVTLCSFADWPFIHRFIPRPLFLVIAFGARGAAIVDRLANSWWLPTLKTRPDTPRSFLTADSLFQWLTVQNTNHLVPVVVIDEESASSALAVGRELRRRQIPKVVAIAPWRVLSDELRGIFSIVFPTPTWAWGESHEFLQEVASFYDVPTWSPPIGVGREADVCIGMREIWCEDDRTFALVCKCTVQYLDDMSTMFAEHPFLHMTICRGTEDPFDYGLSSKPVTDFVVHVKDHFAGPYSAWRPRISWANVHGMTRFRIAAYSPIASWNDVTMWAGQVMASGAGLTGFS